MKIRNWFQTMVVGASLLLLPATAHAQTYNFVSIDVPCAGCPGGIARQTIAEGINAAGAIVGTYKDAANAQHGFLLRNGQFTTIDVPGAVATIATGINPQGQIVGRFTAPVGSANCSASGPQCIHGFLYSQGTFQTLTYSGHPGSFAQRITPDGSIYGCLHDFDLMGSMYGARWTLFGETSLMAGGGELANPAASLPASMNNGATPGGNIIVGHFTDMATNLTHGFIVQNGNLQIYDVPSSTLTQIWDINPSFVFAGTYKDIGGKQHGFVQLPGGGTPITVDYQGAAATVVFGINPAGAIVGQYTLSGQVHGFLAVPSDAE